MLRVRLFGNPELSFEGSLFEVRPSALRLLSYLLVRHGKHSRKSVAFNLWPDDPETIAQARLRRQFYNLRQALPNGTQDGTWFRADDLSIGWNDASDYSLDIRDFERLVAGGTTSGLAADLYVADLAADSDDEWIIVERERLRSLHISNLAKLISECRTKGDYSRGIDYAERLLRLEPWREDVVRQLMALRYESGDRGGALRAYDEFARRLREDMAADPMPETRALKLIVDRNESTFEIESGVRQANVPASPLRGTPFVGREHEMEFLRSCWQRAVAGKGGGLFIAGESGIGKTRLASELAAFVEKNGGRVITGATTSPEAWPYQALSGALRTSLPLLASIDVEPIWLAVLSQLVPDIRAQRTDLPALTPLEKDRDQRRLFDAASRYLESLARTRPLLVVLEDFHWAGSSSIAILDFMIRRAYSNRVLVVATYRIEEVPIEHSLLAVRRRLLRERIATQLEPAPLSMNAIQTLVAQMPHPERLGRSSAERIYRASEGNPLLAIQTIVDLVEKATDGLALPLASDADRSEAPFSAIIERTIASRIARLSAKARAVAEVAAVIGVGFDLETIEEVTGWGADVALNSIGELLDRRLVRESTERGAHDYVFTHHLIQASIYTGVPIAHRRRRHHRVARVIERLSQSRGDDLAGLIASHFERAGVDQMAADYYVKAALSAFALFANEEAIGLATKALELAKNDLTRVHALSLRADIYEHLGNREAQSEDVLSMDAVARRLDDTDLVGHTLSKRIALAHEMDQRDLERDLLAELQALAKRSGESRLLALAAEGRARYETTTGDYVAARANLETALALRLQLDDARGAFECSMLLVDVARRLKDLSQMQLQMERLQEFAARHGSRAISIRTWEAATHIASLKSDQTGCIEAAQHWLAEAESVNDVSAQARAHSALWDAKSYLGRYDEACRHAEYAAELFAQLGDRVGGAWVLLNYDITLIRLGELDVAYERVLRAYSIFRDVEDVAGQQATMSRLVFLSLYRGDANAGVVWGRRAVELARRVGSKFYLAAALGNLSGPEREVGDLEAALSHVNESLALARRYKLPHHILPIMLTSRAQTMLRVGDLRSAKTSVDECLQLLDACAQAMVFQQDNLFVAARVFRALGDDKRASELLKRCRELLDKAYAMSPNAETKAELMRISYNREIVDACERDAWPPIGPQPGDKLPRNYISSKITA